MHKNGPKRKREKTFPMASYVFIRDRFLNNIKALTIKNLSTKNLFSVGMLIFAAACNVFCIEKKKKKI